MGPGRSLLHSPEIDNMGDLAAHEIVSVSQLDQDLRVIVRQESKGITPIVIRRLRERSLVGSSVLASPKILIGDKR